MTLGRASTSVAPSFVGSTTLSSPSSLPPTSPVSSQTYVPPSTTNTINYNPSGLPVSGDGTCGPGNGDASCWDSGFGNCCKYPPTRAFCKIELKIFQVQQEVSADTTITIVVQVVSLHMGRVQIPQQSRHKRLLTGPAASKRGL